MKTHHLIRLLTWKCISCRPKNDNSGTDNVLVVWNRNKDDSTLLARYHAKVHCQSRRQGYFDNVCLDRIKEKLIKEKLMTFSSHLGLNSYPWYLLLLFSKFTERSERFERIRKFSVKAERFEKIRKKNKKKKTTSS